MTEEIYRKLAQRFGTSSRMDFPAEDGAELRLFREDIFPRRSGTGLEFTVADPRDPQDRRPFRAANGKKSSPCSRGWTAMG